MSQAKSNNFAIHAIIYMGGKILARSVSIILLPVYTAYIVPSEYGILSILGITMNLIMLIFNFQLPAAIYRYWHIVDNNRSKRHIVSSVFIFTLTVSTLLIVPLYIFNDKIVSVLNIGSSLLFNIVLFEILLAMLWEVFLTDIRVREESKVYAVLEIGQNLLMAILSIITVVYFHMGIKGIIVSQCSVYFLLVIVFLPRFIRRNGIAINFEIIIALLKYSLPLIPAAVAMAAVHNIDQYFLQKMIGPEATGTYAIGYKFGMLANMLVVGPFLLIWQPRSFEIAKNSDAEIVYGQIFTHLFIAVSFFAVCLTGLSYEIVYFMTDPSYHHAYSLIPWIAWAYVFFALSFVANIGLLVKKQTPILTVIVLIVFSVNLIGNYYGIMHLGTIGAAISTVASFILYLLLNYLISQRFITIKYEYFRLIKVVILIVASILIMDMIDTKLVYLNIALKVFVLTLYSLVIGFSFYREIIRDIFKKFFNPKQHTC